MKIEGIYGDWYDEVKVDGETLTAAESQRVYNHSPDGFAWGYAGSGPAQLALAILLKSGSPSREALNLHQAFKQEFIVNLPTRDNFSIEVDVHAWVDKKLGRTLDATGADISVSSSSNDGPDGFID